VFLRDQRRSKAHRALVPDPGAPCEEVVSIDLAAVDPLLMDEMGVVRPVRDLAGKPVSQVVLGGDSGVTLRDMLAAAMLLKSKRVPSRLDLLVAPPSRQVLEVLAQSGALVDLVATGARILEPDRRIIGAEIYPPPPGGISMRTADPEPRVKGTPGFVVASAETLAYAVATGVVGDPRSFKRPVRVTVPRALPTDDVLILRDKKGEQVSAKKPPLLPTAQPWKAATTLDLHDGLPAGGLGALARSATAGRARAAVAPSNGGIPAPPPSNAAEPTTGLALVLTTLDEVRSVVQNATEMPSLRAVLAPFIPSSAVATLASEGIAAFSIDAAGIEALKGEKILALPAPAKWADTVPVTAGKAKVDLTWLAIGAERTWTHAGTSRAPAKASAR
jgi:aconitate hydratase